mmetsp:Transcript_15399/g.25141  ORF Transcript_15399/g.25141 Transcript_15399/m.25141 type:complete len:415 (+) Transcript_15399:35-1279(+)
MGAVGKDVDVVETKTEGKKYFRTKNPHNKENLDLHRTRFREDKYALAMTLYKGPNERADKLSDKQSRQDRLHTICASKDWGATHMHLIKDMDVCKFVLDIQAQRMLHKMQVILCDNPYNSFGKTVGSWEGYTLMFRNGFQSGDVRKPTTDVFQQYWLDIYVPIMFTMLYGSGDADSETIRKQIVKFKSCSIKVCEDTPFYGESKFHMHIDGKVGITQEKNFSQRRWSRLLFSIVTDALDDPENATAYKYGTTVYPIWQPRVGFANNHEFHRYMHSKYTDVGLDNSGLPRPHYAISEDLVYRATPGQVLYHPTHVDKKTPQAIHSEPNPCPDRHLFVFDFTNTVHKSDTGKYLPCTPIPEELILKHLNVLSDTSNPLYAQRLAKVCEVATDLMPKAEQYPGGCEILKQLVDMICK